MELCLNNQKKREGMKRSLEEDEETEMRKGVDECKENGLSI